MDVFHNTNYLFIAGYGWWLTRKKKGSRIKTLMGDVHSHRHTFEENNLDYDVNFGGMEFFFNGKGILGKFWG